MLVRDIEKALTLMEQGGCGMTGLSRCALIHLGRRLDESAASCRVLELGGGRSTLFWRALRSLELLPVEVTTVDHHTELVCELQRQLKDEEWMMVHVNSLKQITDEEWKLVFADPPKARAAWASLGKPVPEAQYDFYTIRNAFYGEADQIPLELQSVDVMIVDGPHGNGRSLAYPLFCGVLKQDALVLVDDFDHYPFLSDLGRVFHYNEIRREVLDQHWALVRLQGVKS